MITSDLLAGNKTRLTALTSDDLSTIAGWYRNAEFMRLLDSIPAHPKTEASLAQWMEETQKTSCAFLFAIRLLDSDELIGFIELDGIEWTHQVGGVGIAIGQPENWGKGYGYEAMQLTLRFAFDELNLHLVQLTVFSYNARAIALYEKLGFQREGVHREHLQRDGTRYDMYLYGLLRREWNAHNKTTKN